MPQSANSGTAEQGMTRCRLREGVREQGFPWEWVRIMTETIMTTTRPARPVRQLLAASVGNAVEWYDWYCPTART